MHLRLRAAALVAAACLALLSTTETTGQPLRPAEHYAELRRAQRLAGEGDAAAAAAIYERLAAADPRNGDLWVGLHLAYAAAGRHADAARAGERALALGYGRGAAGMYRVAQQHAAAGDREAAFRWLQRAVDSRLENRPRIANDTLFTSLRGDPRFARLAGTKPEGLSRDEGWRHDLRWLVDEARRLHVGFDRPAFSPGFEAAARRLEARIPELDDTQVALEMRRLTTMLGDGHSYVSLRASRLPVDFYLFADGLHVLRGHGDAARWAGMRVVRIGTLSADSVVRRMEPLSPRDNPMGVKARAPFFLNQPALLKNIGAIADTSAVELVLRDAAGAEHTVVLRERAVRPASLAAALSPAPAGLAAAPLWLQRADSAYWLAPLPEADAVYLQYNQVTSLPNLDMGTFSDSLLAVLRGKRNLIIDLRHNGGGNNFTYGALLAAVIAHERMAPGNRVWVLIGRSTFSAAQNFTNDLDRLTGAVFVGEPTGSRPNFVGENASVVLPVSGLQVSISSRYHQAFDWLDGRIWIAPDVPAPLSAADYFAGRDPALDAVLEIIRTGEGG